VLSLSVLRRFDGKYECFGAFIWGEHIHMPEVKAGWRSNGGIHGRY